MANIGITKPRIGVTIGDPAGIGPELVARLLGDGEVRRQAEIHVYGHSEVLAAAAALVALDLPACLQDGPVAVHEPADRPDQWPAWGGPSPWSGRLALSYLQLAIEDAGRGRLDGLVTAPLSKEAVAGHLPGFSGHTEYLAAAFGCTDRVAMMLQVDDLRALHVTTHCSLAAAIAALTVPAVLAKIRQAWQVVEDLHLEPRRVGVMALNPHAGEAGLFGSEEREILTPAIALAQEEGIEAVGPISPDMAFVRARRGEFSMVVVLYHDQGHIPLKLLGWERGVNVTIGLPLVRTSPDHGTGWDIAGRGVANAGSMFEAWRLAVRLARAAPACS